VLETLSEDSTVYHIGMHDDDDDDDDDDYDDDDDDHGDDDDDDHEDDDHDDHVGNGVKCQTTYGEVLVGNRGLLGTYSLMAFELYIHPSNQLSIHLSIHISIYLSIRLSTHSPTHTYLCLLTLL
jgi:hypothetical protein